MHPHIEDYALIGDHQTAALVSRQGSIDWLCLPRFDSAACFAALLGDEENGHWRIAPAEGGTCTRRAYRHDSLVLDTEWETDEGAVRVTDLMPQRDRAPDVVRIVEGLSGRVTLRSTLRLRFDYGSVVPWMRRSDGHRVAVAGPDSVWLRSEPGVRSWSEDRATYAEFTVEPGEKVAFVLTWHPSHEPRPRLVDPYRSLRSSLHDWQAWAARCRYDGPHRDTVVRSLITLKALTYAPTGGIVAAATTSLPEEIGGVRNWDYRHCWLRDSTLALGALLACGYQEEAEAWRDWLLRAAAGDPADLQIMYGLAGERRIPEHDLPWLSGYEGSRPVRVGNDAVHQLQLDVYGEVIDSLFVSRRSGLPDKPDMWRMQCALMEYLLTAWRKPDEGLWEVRGPRRHFTHSKVMCWVAADRAVRTLEDDPTLTGGDLDGWRALRDEIHREVCERGYDADRNTFTQSYGSRELDAALLLIPLMGFLPPDDPRVIGTVDAIREELSHEGLVRRYGADHLTAATGSVDGLPGGEGTFLVCSFWLADALHLTGRTDQARELFERLVGLVNDVGLLAEEYDPVAGRQLGNFPQAFSHVGLVGTALALFDGEKAG
ncbi:glycoside hydrolase family 15 protein [Streptomyces europaeiscabiei]|uniref:Glycoside hydrolase family 15 protein n=1 Tax=Streptomyces europaeiscabiei TaxID=146819 RepID=A0ABU4NI66_9ACTN|nr:glycoside hydrolase family 15 protein [Streptomyces europaeiscabiei]MDX2529404.1 glycoside hydrolase family 15 protein [Streptomyces europaeiscabiei]MDX2773087.1 glycoside hydrolase family 15 protein [Streptomyces europaeiscabiei]MDX3543859.1 glycoside hydrolase family 15 protein [Streptomyces europaeiscabiei]MDX3553304.1 glycoside hydrolase family 15 protein [Streptomyces europaeiscabiei]MDX3671441.1 glycoside hydrolase family 15 protein [Streptomyces europaeiscabiei]